MRFKFRLLYYSKPATPPIFHLRGRTMSPQVADLNNANVFFACSHEVARGLNLDAASTRRTMRQSHSSYKRERLLRIQTSIWSGY
jgi:hypothetical protein